jgi:lysozyme
MTPQQLAELRGDEGTELRVYDDATGEPIVPGSVVKGHPTIGTGRCLDTNGISDTEAEYLLSIDVARCEMALGKLGWWLALDPVRKGVCVNLAFNMGVAGLLTFRLMIRELDAKDWDRAVAELLDSRWAEQVQPSRRDRLVAQLRTGEIGGAAVA